MALETAEGSLTYDALDISANRLSRFLRERRVGPGDRVAVLLDRPTDALVAHLAIAKIGAAWVPLAPGLPDRSLAAVIDAAGTGVVLTTTSAAPRLVASDVDAIYLDRVADRVEREDTRRLPDPERVSAHAAPAYVVVHSDEPHRGLRVTAVGHQAVTNLVQVMAELVDLGTEDRVFHDGRLGSDLAVLETWLPWACGATVVTPPGGSALRGPALGQFLRSRRITALHADAELLRGIDVDLPDLRLILFSGPERPRDPIARWRRPGRRLVGLHGSPETTVVALWSELGPERSSTLGRPLPTYDVVVLDLDDPSRVLGAGGIGEIGITGVGVARGYVGRDDLTREGFVTLGERTVFRSGDLGRVTADGEVERLGRLDGAAGRGIRTPPHHASLAPRPSPRPPRRARRTTVLQLPATHPEPPPTVSPPRPGPPTPPAPAGPPSGPGRRGPAPPPRTPDRGPAGRPIPPGSPKTPSPASMPPAPLRSSPRQPSPSVPPAAPAMQAALATTLAAVLGRDDVPPDAHFFNDLGADSLLMARFCARIRKDPQLPSAAMQDIYQHPTLAKLAAALAPSPPPSNDVATPAVREALGTLLASVLGRESVSADAHFFNDLGADSLSMAHFCAKVRKHPDLPSLGMPDIYRHTTLASLAASLMPSAITPGALPSAEPPAPEPASDGPRPGTPAYVMCALAQLTFFLAYSLVAAVLLTWAFEWLTLASGPVDLYLRALGTIVGGFAVLTVVPVAVKWLLVGRWQPGSIRVWSPAYLRFWIIKVLIRTSPMTAFAGTPAFSLYLRALGAKIGPGVVLLTRHVPVATDLVSVGRGTLVRKDCVVACYRAHDGHIEIGGVTLGEGVVVGEATVLDVRTSIADGGALSHSSSLHPGQTVPAGETWNGSPGRRSDITVPTVPPASCGRLRRALYPLLDIVAMLLVIGPIGIAVLATLYRTMPQVAMLIAPDPAALAGQGFYGQALVLSAVLYFGAVIVGLAIVMTLPRLLALGLHAGSVYPLYGFRYWLHQSIVNLTNVRGFLELFGDSSAVAHYLRLLGYRLRPMEQTGSNFGMSVKHENPFLTWIGTGTVIADGLSVMNADYSATSFRVSATAIGARNFLGNNIAYPTQGRTGDDCLLATKVAVPVDGPVRTGVGLLGSPSFEIPRTVARDAELDVTDPAELARSLRRKNRHNTVTMGLHLVVRWLLSFAVLLVVTAVATMPVALGALEVLIAEVGILLLVIVWFVVVERCSARLKTHAPSGCSIYDRAFWRHERYWKVPSPSWMRAFDGTPFKSLIWRLLGVRIGARVFDDGAAIIERGFTTIGDDCTLGEGSIIQCHSQEDGGFKSDYVVIGARCTLGVNSFVHYGTTIGDDVILAPDTFLMKGEEVPAGARWGGNPARETASDT